MSEPNVEALELPYGSIVGDGATVHADGSDINPHPDVDAFDNVRVIFTPSDGNGRRVNTVIWTGADGPTILHPQVEVGRFVDGRLVLDVPTPPQPDGMRLMATVSDDMVPNSWGWKMEWTGWPSGKGPGPVIFPLTPGATVDIAEALAGYLPEVPAVDFANLLAAADEVLAARDQTVALRDEVQVISGLTGEDAAVAALVSDTNSATAAALNGPIAAGAAAATIGALAPSRARPIDIGQQLTRYQPGHGWTTSAANTDATQHIFGTQSMKFATAGAGAPASIAITGLTPRDWSNVGMFRAWMMVDNPERLARIEFQLGSSVSGWTDYFKNPITDFNLGQVVAGQSDATTAGPMVWTPVEIPSYMFTVGAGVPDMSNISRVRVFAYDNSGGPVNVWINNFEAIEKTSAWPDGVLTIDFDDNYASVYEYALPAMSAYGFRGTAFIINDTVGSHASYMDMAQVRELQDFHGWEINAHSHTAAAHTAGFTNMTVEALDVELRAAKAWLLDNGFNGQHLAYPGGQFNTDVVRVASRYFTTSRTVKLDATWITPTRPHEVMGIPVTNVTDVATMKLHVDRAKQSGIPRHLIFHRFEPGASATNAIAWGADQFAELMEYIATQGVPVATHGEIYRP